MGIPAAVDVPIYDLKLFPRWLAQKLLLKYRLTTCIERITTTDYTAQLSKGGTTVDITLPGAGVIHDYVKGAPTVVEMTEPSTVTFEINRAKEWAIPVYDVDKVQATIKGYWDEVAQQTGMDLAEMIEKDFFADIIDDADADNLGLTAGVNSEYNLGTAGAPLELAAETTTGKTTITSAFLRMGGVLSDQGVDKMGRFIVCSPFFSQMLKDSKLGNVYVTGDASSPLRNGEVGTYDKFTIYESTRLPVTGGVTPIIFGSPRAIAFFTQMKDTKKVQGNVDLHSEFWLGLQVYDWKAIRPKGFGVMYVTV